MLALLALLPLTRALPCPPTCVCNQLADGRDELRCWAPSGNFTIQGILQESVIIKCEEYNVSCSELPRFLFSRNGSLSSLRVVGCALRGALARCLAALGVRRVRALELEDLHHELQAEHVAGLRGVRALTMRYADAQHTIPSDALRSIPDLNEFRLSQASIPAPLPLRGLPNLTSLELSDDNIKTFADVALELGQLQELHIWGNQIEKITEENFIGLSSLQTLDLSSNRLRGLPARALARLPSLTRLYINDNCIQEVDSNAFYGLLKLKEIDASDNSGPLYLYPHSLSNLPSLQDIKFDNCQITYLPPDVFLNSTELSSISLTKNQIEVLPVGLFCDQRSLTTLNLSENLIATLPPTVFRALGRLLELNLDDNLIVELPDKDIFTGLSNMRILKINNNKLRHIAGTAFSPLSALTDLSLAHNQLTLRAGQLSPFHTLNETLENLDLSRNKISHIFSDWQNFFTRLKVLNLSRNEFTIVQDVDMQFISKNTIVDLRYNNISSVDLFNSTTDTLFLEGNPFTCDCKSYNFFLSLHSTSSDVKQTTKAVVGSATCVGPPQLKGELVKNVNPSIVTCPLDKKDCPDECFCDIRPSTKHLELTCSLLPRVIPNPIKDGNVLNGTKLKLTTKPTDFNLPSHVDTLILSGLQLRKPKLSLPSSVYHVDLTNNGFTEIPVELLKRNMTMQLSGNPFSCDCSHGDALRVLQSNQFKVMDNSTVSCSDQQSPWPIDVSRLCFLRNAAVIGGTLAMLSLILIILASLYCRYSIKIKIYLYSCEKLRWMIAEEDIDKDKKYDAFISFSHKDEKFVAEELVPVLESGSRPFKLCVHYRDWVVGEWIPTQIEASVEQSRRTIIVLSKSFVESVWGIMEFRVAHERAQKERRTRVVVILLKDAPCETDLDAELKAYLATNTYVQWGDPWFWQKLRYALAGRRLASRPKSERILKNILEENDNNNGQVVNYTRDSCRLLSIRFTGDGKGNQ